MSDLPVIVCNKCGHRRVPRVVKPLKCPVCGHIPGTKIRNSKATPYAGKQSRVASNPFKGGLL